MAGSTDMDGQPPAEIDPSAGEGGQQPAAASTQPPLAPALDPSVAALVTQLAAMQQAQLAAMQQAQNDKLGEVLAYLTDALKKAPEANTGAASEGDTHLGVDLDTTHNFAPARQAAYNFAGADRQFRWLSYVGEHWHQRLSDRVAEREELSCWRSTAFYLHAVNTALGDIVQAATGEDAASISLSDVKTHLVDILASCSAVNQWVTDRTAFLELKATAERGDPTGQVAALRAWLIEHYRAEPATGSAPVDAQRHRFNNATREAWVKLLAKGAAQELLSGARDVPVGRNRPAPHGGTGGSAGGAVGTARGFGGRGSGGAAAAGGGRTGGRGGRAGGRGRSSGAELAPPAGAAPAP